MGDKLAEGKDAAVPGNVSASNKSKAKDKGKRKLRLDEEDEEGQSTELDETDLS